MRTVAGSRAAVALITGILAVATLAVADAAGATAPNRDARLSVGTVTVAEGDAGVRIIRVPITLDAPLAAPVTVDWSLTGADGAVAGAPSASGVDADFRAAAGAITFARNVVARTVNVAVYGDTRNEGDETVTVSVTPRTAGIDVPDVGGVVLLDDEGTSGPAVTVGAVHIAEGDARVRSVSVPITVRTSTPNTSITVRTVATTATGGWTGAGAPPFGVDVGDRSGAVRTISFGTATTRYVTVPLAPDLAGEADESVAIRIVAAPVGVATTDADLVIRDDDGGADPATGDFGPASAPVGTLEPGSTLVGCAQAGNRITVTASIHLDPACTYTRGFDIGTSAVTLDCRGARIDRPVGGSDSLGIRIAAPTTAALHDVTVRNCVVADFDNDLRITRTGFKDLVVGHEYDTEFAGITIEHSRFLDSRNSGVFVDGFVTGITLDHIEVDHAGAVGIYLEAGSRGSVISHSIVTDSGYKDVDAGPQTFTLGSTTVQYVSTGREGISVDGSSGNTIRDNYIARNSYGGVFLYKNCGENASKPGHWVRNYGADDNAIVGNVIEDEPHGVWVASRAAENQYFMDCSDTPLVSNPSGLQSVFLDPVVGTVVEFNRIRRTANAIRVEGDLTTVRANVIESATNGVIVGTQFRTTVGSTPVSGPSILWNTTTSVTTPYSWVWGTSGSSFFGNVGNGANGRFVTGNQPPTGPFLMVDHFV